MLVSKYGFSDVLHTGQVMVDPSRVAAQIVTGIGFLGAGLILVRRDMHVHGMGSVNDLATRLSELPGVRAVTSEDANAPAG